ncbi:hypothetical protein [Capybara microvirus Cap1_SP_93]|nr:hypothetical protein [Capybara microvirus Cap1_SP_93]
MAFFPLNFFGASICEFVPTEKRYILSKSIDPNNENNVLTSGVLDDVPIFENSKDLPNPDDTDLARQLLLGSPIQDYSGTKILNGKELVISDSQANDYLAELEKTLVKN